MLDAGGGGAVARIGFVADTVSAGPAGSGLTAGQTAFTVDLAQAQKLIDGLAEARDRLQELYDQNVGFMILGSPGQDPYSQSATTTIKQTAGTDPGGYGWASLKAIDALNSTIESIQASLATYQNQEQANADAFKGEGNQS
ncbi:hypothetical protein LZG04_01480 [Saccharothrix sp. S26]|uniref:hypothetical protein n=1 Tax=Saccharothrix sp. S26 TaxID=2907215 RepID=UPI001F2E68E9|nr:hypothetical protein [Saccharothrix sp. S26]MCE6993484.1 hypothetical protein [Saccharothrix sp. S26]